MSCVQEAADLAARAAQEQQRQLQEAAAKAARFEAQVAAAAAEFAATAPPPAGSPIWELELRSGIFPRFPLLLASVARFVFVQLTFVEQFPGDAARVYFVCDGVQHMFVHV